MNVDTSFLYEEFVPLINEYDGIFKSIQKQLQTYKDDHDSLEKNLKKIINENKSLSKQLEDALEIKNNLIKNDDEKYSNDILNNLKIQITVLSQEKDTIYDLWQNSLKIIDHLETELYIYKENKEEFIRKTELDKEKQKHAQEMKELQKQLKTSLNQQEQKNKTIFKDLEVRGCELQAALEGQKTTLNKIEEKNSKIQELKEILNKLANKNDNLKIELNKKEEIIKKLYLVDQDSKAKVLESIILIEASLCEKEAALKRENEAKEEVKELSNKITNFLKEADEKMKKEKEKIKIQYNENLSKLEEDMKSVQRKSDEKGIQIEKLTRETKMLEDEISRLKKGNIVIDDNNTSKLLILEKNLESTFQKLLISERRMMQTTTEKEKIQIELDQLLETSERDKRTLGLEKLNLERKIKTTQKELSISNGYVEEYVVQIKELNKKITDLEEEMNNKLLTNEKTFQKVLTAKINNVKTKNIAIQNEMEYHLNSEHNLNKKWKKESKDIVDKLYKRIMDLKRENKLLGKKIKQSQMYTEV